MIGTQSQLENCDNPDERVYKSNLGKGPLSEDVGAVNGSTTSKALHYGISKEISIFGCGGKFLSINILSLTCGVNKTVTYTIEKKLAKNIREEI